MSDLIDRQALLKQIDIDSDGEPGYYGDTWKFIDTIKNMPNVHDLPKDTDMISRQAALDAVDSETVSTNPEHFKSSEKFIKFMDDADISSFGKWKWANGFNTALVATTIQLKKLPFAQPERKTGKWIPCSERLPEKHGELYLVTISDGAVYSAALQWDANCKRWYLSFLKDCNILVDFIEDVIAWMPLPEPYREGEE